MKKEIIRNYVYCPFCKKKHIVGDHGNNVFYCNAVFKEFKGDQTFLNEFN